MTHLMTNDEFKEVLPENFTLELTPEQEEKRGDSWDSVCIKFENESCEEQAYWDSLKNIPLTPWYPDGGGSPTKAVPLALGNVIAYLDNGNALVEFQNGMYEILVADLYYLP